MSPRIVSLAALVFLAPGLGAAEESDRPADLQPIAPIGQMRVTNFRNYGGGMEFTFALSPDGKTLAMGSQLPRAARGDGRFRADGTVRAMSRIDRGNGPCQRNTSWKSQTCPIRSFSPHHRRSDGPRAPQCQSAYLNSPRTLRSTVEVDRTGIPFIDELLVEPLSIADGQFAPGSKPGLGVELNAAVVEGLRLDDGALRWRFRLVSALSFAGTSGLWVFFGMPGVRFLLAGGTAIIGTAGLQRTPSGPPVALSPAETLLGGLPGLGTDQVSLQAGAQDDQERFCGQRYSDVPPGKSGMSVEALVAQEHAFSFWVWPSCLGRSASIPRASLSNACPGSRACSSAAESRRTSCRNRARLPFMSECLAPVGPYCLSEHRRAFPQQFNSPLPPCQGKSLPASVAFPVARFELAAPIKPTTDRPGPVESAP